MATDAKPHSRRRRRLVVVVVVAVVLVLCSVPVVHWWPGRGALTYFGLTMRPPQFRGQGVSRYPLATPRNDIAGVANLARISEHLYRGAQPTREGFAQLKAMGIKTIVNLRETHDDRGLIEGLGLHYVELPFNPAAPNDDIIAGFMRTVCDPANQPVFVHCLAGSDRTGTVVAVYRSVVQGWPMDEAVKELERFGFHEVWTELLQYLAALDPKKVKTLAAQRAGPTPEETP
jgi:protein tyrosine phosphatase (PTP) superfamily phosphohydrolase (DUF442 family)